MSKQKKKFRDRPIVKWCKENAPDLIGNSLELVGDITGIEVIEKLGEKISGSEKLTPEQKAEAAEIVKMELEFEKEITARWTADMNSDSWLSKSVRPIVLLYSWVLVTLITVLAACGIDLPGHMVSLIEYLVVSYNLAYVGSRGIEKYQAIRKK